MKQEFHTPPQTRGARVVAALEDPMNSVIAASVVTMSTLGVVLSGAWFINTIVN